MALRDRRIRGDLVRGLVLLDDRGADRALVGDFRAAVVF